MILTNIKVPPHWVHTDDFNSHRELLYLALENTKGTVLEVGMGYGSTFLLEDHCKHRMFVSCETSRDWFDRIREQKDKWYGVLNLLNSYDEIPLIDIGLLFVDCAPAEKRKELIAKFKDKASVIVVHDTETTAEYVYGLKDLLSEFKYRLDYQPEKLPHTTVVSNSIDVSKWV